MAITETWLQAHISDAQVEIPGYTSYRADRKKRRGGGCILYLHNDVVATKQFSYSDNSCSGTIVYCTSLHLLLVAVYRPPAAPDLTFDKLMAFVQEKMDLVSENTTTPDVYILGDFNLPLFDWELHRAPNNPPAKAYSVMSDFLDNNFLTQLVTEATRGENILDLVLTNRPQEASSIQVLDNRISDHKLVECTLVFNPIENVRPNVPELDPLSFRAVNYHKADFEKLRSALSSVDWLALKDQCEATGDPDGSSFKDLLCQTVLQLTQQHSPSKIVSKPRIRGGKIGRIIEPLKRRRRKLRKRIATLRQHNSDSPTLKSLLSELNRIAYGIKEALTANLELEEANAVRTIKSNPKYFFSYAKRFSKSRSSIAPLQRQDGTLTTDPTEKAQLLQQQYVSVFSNPLDADVERSLSWVEAHDGETFDDFTFTPKDIEDAIGELDPYSAAPDGDIPAKVLTECKAQLAYPIWLLWDKSFQQGVIPPTLKQQTITPIFKKGNKADPSNYRPVSLTSHLIKTFERVLRIRLVDHLERNNILPDNQHGFRKNRSCLTQLLEHVDSVLKELNSGKEVDVIYLDYSKAFDKVDHTILLEKIKKYGIGGKVFTWIENFLTGRVQAVTVEGFKSSLEDVESGVPQGTVNGPIYFIIYVIDLALQIRNSIPLAFADDTKLMKAIISMICSALLQDDLGHVVEWSKVNNMVLHENKFEVMNFCLNHGLPVDLRQYVTPSGVQIEPKDTVRDLGVLISSDCSWTPHVCQVTAGARKMAAWVFGAFKDRSPLPMITLFKSMVRSKLEYCCPVWDPSKIGDIQAIENIQRQFTRKILGCKDLDYWDRLKKLRLMSLQRRRERYSIIQTWKILQKCAPNSTGIIFYDSDRLGVRARVPTLNHKAQRSVATIYDNSFGVRAPRLWNMLPKGVNTVTTLDSFKVALGKFLDRFPDKPPVLGYTTPNNNSLLSWSAAGVGVSEDAVNADARC